jgi:hypothetical protein
MRRVLAAVLVMSAACGSTGGNTPTTEPAPTTTLPATTTTTVSEQARCALFVDGLTDPLTTTVQSLLEFERLATEATTTVDLNPIATT